MDKITDTGSAVHKNRVGGVQKYIGNFDANILVAFFCYGLMSQYFLLSLISGVTLVVLIKNLWKPFLPPVLLFFLSFHWIQVFSSIIYADFLGLSLDVVYGSSDLEFLFGMTFFHIILMALVMNLYLKSSRWKNVNRSSLIESAAKINVRNVIIGYGILAVLIPVLERLTQSSTSLFQLVILIGIIKYLFLGLLIFIVLLRKTKYNYLITGILLFDFIMSFTSFFSGFKVLIFLAIITYLTVNPYIKKGALYRVVPLAALLIVLFSFWSYVKGDYREFLNQGTLQQAKLVSNTAALSYIYQEAKSTSVSALQDGATIFLKRLQYMERYSEVYERVPEVIPHQNGEDLSNTLEFILVPRFLNPDKNIKDASKRTSYYTGKRFSKAKQGTSISMGYFCDLFIDFGIYLMILPLMLIAALIGLINKYLLSLKGYNILFQYSLIGASFLSLGTFESDSTFFLGSLRNLIVFLIVFNYLVFPRIQRFIVSKK